MGRIKTTLDWCREIIEGSRGLKSYEKHELVVWHCPREVAVAQWVLDCLANPKCEGSGEVLEAILEKRRKVGREEGEMMCSYCQGTGRIKHECDNRSLILRDESKLYTMLDKFCHESCPDRDYREEREIWQVPQVNPDGGSLDDLFAWCDAVARRGGLTEERSKKLLKLVRAFIRVYQELWPEGGEK